MDDNSSMMFYNTAATAAFIDAILFCLMWFDVVWSVGRRIVRLQAGFLFRCRMNLRRRTLARRMNLEE
jgi:hypothetical protein